LHISEAAPLTNPDRIIPMVNNSGRVGATVEHTRISGGSPASDCCGALHNDNAAAQSGELIGRCQTHDPSPDNNSVVYVSAHRYLLVMNMLLLEMLMVAIYHLAPEGIRR
jgi:hypothetical protein